MSKLWKRPALVALAFTLPVAAFAASNVTFQFTTYTTAVGTTGTATLNPGQSMDFETGAAVSSGGDLSWDGTSLTPAGKTLAANVSALGLTGTSGYNTLTQAFLQQGLAAGLGTKAPITGLIVGSVVGLQDNSGNVAKLLVTALGAGSGGGGGGPTITAIQNNYSYLVPGLPNYGIAQGALFIIKGTGLASATTVTTLNDPSAGIPTSWNGASISVTVGGVTTTPAIYYAIATQLAAVLPSNTPAGTGTLTVTYSGATATSPITVVSSALGLDTYYGTGSGLGVATNAVTGALYNYTNSIPPGTTVVLWGSGLGNTGDSDTTDTSSPHAVSNPPTFYVGGIQATPLYAGRSVYPGVNQINLTIPASVTPGCGVSVVAVSGSGSSAIVSNTVTLPIGNGVCSDAATGITGTTLNTLTGKANYNSGSAFIIQSTSQGQTLGAAFASFQNVQSAGSSNVSGLTSIGSCTVSTSAVGSTISPILNALDAGTITVTGPTGTPLTLATFPGVLGESFAQLPAGFFPTSGGTFTFKGSGGTQVGAFTTSVSYTNPLVWTNSSAITAVNRASGQPINWTGGAPASFVYISGTSSSSTASASFTCYAPVSAGSFTVPSYVLLAMPAGSGTLGVTNESTPVSFSASGLDYGIAFGGVSFSINATYN